MTSSPLSPSSVPLGIPAVEPSEAISPAACVPSEADNYVTFLCEEPKAEIVPEKVCAQDNLVTRWLGRHIWKVSTWKCSFLLHESIQTQARAELLRSSQESVRAGITPLLTGSRDSGERRPLEGFPCYLTVGCVGSCDFILG